jgi:hypothetical protein
MASDGAQGNLEKSESLRRRLEAVEKYLIACLSETGWVFVHVFVDSSSLRQEDSGGLRGRGGGRRSQIGMVGLQIHTRSRHNVLKGLAKDIQVKLPRVHHWFTTPRPTLTTCLNKKPKFLVFATLRRITCMVHWFIDLANAAHWLSMPLRKA